MDNSVRIYVKVPNSKIVFLQALIDSYEGLARVRTETRGLHSSLVLLMTMESQMKDVYGFLRHFEEEHQTQLEYV